MTHRVRPMRVAQFVEALESGGAEALAVDIANGLAAAGHDSRIIVLRGGGTFAGRILPPVKLHDLDRPRRDGSQLQRIAYFLDTARRLVSLIRAERIEVLQCHLPKANFLGLFAALARSCGVCVTVHNNREFDYGDNAGELKRRLRRAGYRQMLRRCQCVITVSDQVRHSLLRELSAGEADGGRICVIPNGVRVPELCSVEDRAAARLQWGVADDEVLIVSVGRLTRQKNHRMLLDAFASMPDNGTSWRCVIAGEGELESELKSEIQKAHLGDRVILAGLVADVPCLLAAADVFCLPSLFEGLPLALLEAMAAGLPVVGTAIDGITELVADGRQGRLVKPGDSKSLGIALAGLMADGGRRRNMGRESRRVIERDYSFGVALRRIEGVYAEVVSVTGRGHAGQ